MGIRRRVEPDGRAVEVEPEVGRVRREQEAAIVDIQAIRGDAEQELRQLAREPDIEDADEIER